MKLKPVVTWTAFVVVTLALAVGSIWPFLNAWHIRETPAWIAARDWVLESPEVETIAGGHRETDGDWFPKGGAADGQARYEFRVIGDKEKVKLSVLLEERDGAWVVTRAAKDESGTWAEIVLR